VLGEALGILDFKRAAKVSGARFTFLVGDGARLEHALVRFMRDLHAEHGDLELLPPYLVGPEALRGTGQLPKFKQDLFEVPREGAEELYLVPTAEVPVTNYHADEILEAADLPLRYFAFSPCFRSEAGSYGKDVRGYIRQHQFQKVEMVRFCAPEDSLDELDLMTDRAEEVLRRLGLHHRVVTLCSADTGFGAWKTHDVEVWLPSQGAFREISSCSTCGDFQARRARIRYRPEPGAKPRFVHTLNGSGLAVGRTLVALLEQGQRPDGGVDLPEAIRPYFGADEIAPR
jgi:seryl-tRNA synthetase